MFLLICLLKKCSSFAAVLCYYLYALSRNHHARTPKKHAKVLLFFELTKYFLKKMIFFFIFFVFATFIYHFWHNYACESRYSVSRTRYPPSRLRIKVREAIEATLTMGRFISPKFTAGHKICKYICIYQKIVVPLRKFLRI